MSVSNIAEHLIERARELPNSPAVVCSLGQTIEGRRAYTVQTFATLNQESAAVAFWLKRIGVKRGSKAVVMVRPGPDLFALTFGLFKAGIVPVLIDPGMDKRALKDCIAVASPELFIGIPIAHLARKVLGWGKSSVKLNIVVGGAQRGGRAKLSGLISRLLGQYHLNEAYACVHEVSQDYLDERSPDSLAAILYTSGSTGTPKGAMYRHRHFAAQVELLRSSYQFKAGSFDVPTFPLFALFDPALGMSAVFPSMDYSAPAKANPAEIFAAIDDFGAENLFCSPALLRNLASSLRKTPRNIKSLKRVISAGAPVPVEEMDILRQACHEEAEIYTPYGATESLPVSSVSCQELLDNGHAGQRAGFGVCVGHPTPGVVVTIIRVSDEPLSSWEEVTLIEEPLRADEPLTPQSALEKVGELVVYGPSTTQSYLAHSMGDALSKIQGPPPGAAALEGQELSHRMGDLGYYDEAGRLWLCGRKSHRVDFMRGDRLERWLPHCVEGSLNHLEGISRTALVDYEEGPVLCVELNGNESWTSVFKSLEREVSSSKHLTGLYAAIEHPCFPVDTRHNAKIKREVLKSWVAERSSQLCLLGN